MRNPFRVARFTNATTGVLERGAIAVFEDGSFLGQGMMDPLPAGASATVPFALERAIAIDKEQKFDELGARISKVENGELTIERDSVMLTKYRVKNGGDKLAKVIIKHPRQSDARLYEPPQGTEDNVGTATALVPGRVPPHVTGEIDVDERRTVKREEDWFTNVADNAVKAYLADKGGDKATQTKLAALWQIRNDFVSKNDGRTKLAREQADLSSQSEETRRNLKAIEKNKQADQLRAKLTQHLGEMATRLDTITKETVELDAKLAELRVRFKEAVREIRIAPRGPDR